MPAQPSAAHNALPFDIHNPPTLIAAERQRAFGAPPPLPPPPSDTVDASYCATLYEAMRERQRPRNVPDVQWQAYMSRLLTLASLGDRHYRDSPPVDNFRRYSTQELRFSRSTVTTDALYSHVQGMLAVLPASIELDPVPDSIERVD